MSVYVFGGANIDIIGRSDSKIISYDSNIGKVIQTFGGVGRNIAENIARYGIDVQFISVLGDDVNGHNCIKYCQDLGMNMDNCMIMENEHTSSYLAVLDETGDMILAINDMDILRFMNIDYIARVMKNIQKDDIIVMDTNYDQDIIDFVLENAICDVYVDPISCKKAEKIQNRLKYIHTLKPNIYEAEVLSGIKYDGMESVDKMGEYLLEQGVNEVYISLGEKGAKIFTKDKNVLVASEAVEVVNATGAGDAFMGALVAGSVLGYELVEKIKFASAASVCTIETGASVCRNLSINFVNNRKNKLKFNVKEITKCI